MQTVRYEAADFNAEIAPVTRDLPDPTGTEVIVKVTHAGVCHSDIHIHEGVYNLGGGKTLSMGARGVTPPLVMGHEIVGTVVATGPDADASLTDRTFVVYPWIGCGTCPVCVAGQENYCLQPRFLGVMRPGGYAEHCVVPHERYLIDITGIEPGAAATCACAGLTTYSAINKLGDVASDEWVAVMSAGGLGQTAIAQLAMRGIKNVVVVDPDADKRATAERLGAAATVASGPNAAAELKQVTGGNLVGSLDFVGLEETAQLGIDCVRKGGMIVLVGLYGGQIQYPIPFIVTRALKIIGSYIGNLQELRDYIDFVKQNGMPPIKMEERAMADAGKALSDLQAGKVAGRAVLVA